jgi:hypothetical protein
MSGSGITVASTPQLTWWHYRYFWEQVNVACLMLRLAFIHTMCVDEVGARRLGVDSNMGKLRIIDQIATAENPTITVAMDA